jgi:hypothetical protein
VAISVARAETPVQSTDVFTLRDNQFYLDGQPFAEMSFNKFDLMWEIWDGIRTCDRTGDSATLKKAIAEQDDAVRGLHEMGFRTIRIFGAPWAGNAATFAEARPTKPILEAIDTTLDLCARHDIKVVFSLGLGLFAYEDGEAAPGDAPKPISLFADPASKARADCYAYLDLIVNRYKDRKSIAMWEVSNELTNLADIGVRKGKLSPTLPQVAEFFDSTARRIHADDPLRLVSDGGSHLRESAWHLWQGLGWPKDSLEQYRKAYAAYFQHSAIDVIDNHYYDLRKGGLQLASTPDGKPVWMTPAQYVEIAHSLGKGAIIGEYGTLPSGWESRKASTPDAGWFIGYHDPNAAKWVQKGVDDLVDARVSIAYWWAYQSDRPVDQRANPVVFGERTTPDLMKIIKEGNRRLKAEMGAPLGGSSR